MYLSRVWKSLRLIVKLVIPTFSAAIECSICSSLSCPERLHWTKGTTTINIPNVPAREEDRVVVIHGQVGELLGLLFSAFCAREKLPPKTTENLKQQLGLSLRLPLRLFFLF